MKITSVEALKVIATNVRKGIIEEVYSAKSGHPGGALSIADILTVLYFNQMNIDEKKPNDPNRDRLVLSKGHASAALYSVLAEKGYFDKELLKTFRKIDGELQGHPEMKHIPGVDMTTGSLGQGLSAAVGMAIASKMDNAGCKIYCIVGDGEDVINRCIEKAYTIIDEKNPALENKEAVAEKVGVGAVIFGALYNSKIKDIVFSYDKVLNFDGETSVYVQYTCARANSVLEKGGIPDSYEIVGPNAVEFELIKALSAFPDTVKDAADKYEPSYIARYAVDVSQKFNKFYFDCKILSAEDEPTKKFRLALTAATLQTLKNAFALLGIGIPEKM